MARAEALRPRMAALTVIIKEKVVKDAKIKAIREKTNVSRVTEELLLGWLSGDCELKK